MSSTVEYNHLIFSQKFSSVDYFFVYATGENSVFGLVQTTPDCASTPEAYIPDEGVVDTMVDDMLEAMEPQNGRICDDSDSSCDG